jgi:hypothetical protein
LERSAASSATIDQALAAKGAALYEEICQG